MPIGPASAPETDMRAAPGNACEPVARPTTPRLYLSDTGDVVGHHRPMSLSSGTHTAGRAASHGSPMSTRSTCPAYSTAGPTTSAGLRQPKATVTSARTAGPSTWPVLTSTPLGTSTATTI